MSALTGSPILATGGDDDSSGDRGPAILKASVALICLSTISVALRLWSRKLVKLKLLLSDWVLLIALIFSVAFSVLEIVAVKHGLGKHILQTNFFDDILLLKILFAEGIVYTIALTSTKLSILLLYRTIFPTSPTRSFRIAGYITAGLCIAWGISTLLGSIFSCTPVSDYWNVLNPTRQCVDQYAWYKGTSIANIITDGMILVLPVASVWQLQLSWKAKVSVSGLFLLGGFVVVASIVRIVVLVNMESSDITWNYYGVAIWSVIEVNTAVISTCLPTLRPLLLLVAPWFKKIGLSLRSFVPGGGGGGGGGGDRGRGYRSAGSKSAASQGRMPGRQMGGRRPGAMPAYGSETSTWLESLQGYPYCETKVQSEHSVKESWRGPRRVKSDEEMAELVPMQRPQNEGGILVQKDVVQTWNRTEAV